MNFIDLSDGLDTEFAVAAIILALALTAWAVAAAYVQSRGHRERPLRRYCQRVIRERGLAQYRPTVTIFAEKHHALIEWTEEGQPRGIMLTWHHALDTDHAHHDQHDHEETRP